jgi:DNA polymerase-4
VRFARYREFSDRIFAIFREEAALVQPVSVDEAYIDVSPGRFTSEHPVSIARRIQERIDAIGLSASIGVATSRTVAKIASDHDKPHGLTVVPSGEEAAFLAPLPVRDMPGIGPRTAERLTTLGVRTLGDLAALDDATSRAVLGTHGTALVRRARGIDESQVRQHRGAKSLSAERTFSRDVHEETEVEEILRSLAEKVGRRLRRAELVGRTVTVKVRFADFSTRTVQRTLSAPTDDEIEIFPVARSLVREVWTPGVGLRLLGLGLSGFGERSEQLSLAACEEGAPYGNDVAARQEERRQKLTPGLDAVRERFGDDAVAFGSELRRRKQRESGD